MKEIRPLKFEELTIQQKLGLAHVALFNEEVRTPERDSFILDLVKKRSLGGVWPYNPVDSTQKLIDMILEVADYPILIMTDAESGIGEYLIGKHNAIGCVDSEEHAYNFGKVVGVAARKMGYNVVCNPLLDISTTGSSRSLGSDKERIAALSAAEARGMRDAGVLTVGKHYPSGVNYKQIDAHMAESQSIQTKEELLDYSLYAYRKLIEEDLLDGLMTSHIRLVNIDPNYPASLSKPVQDIIREVGFQGFLISDGLCMMGIRAKYGFVDSHGLPIAAGSDLALPMEPDCIASYEAMCTCYEKGMITDERLNEAVKRVLAAQEKTLRQPKITEITEKDVELFEEINTNSVYARFDDGLTATISREGRHYFALMVRNEEKIGAEAGIMEDTFSNGWLYPDEVKKKILELFPNSAVQFIYQFPTQMQNEAVLKDSIGYEDVIFLTFTEPLPYMGKEHLTRRIETLIEAMQFTNRISTVIHFGNPLVLQNLPHIPRYILGFTAAKSVNACLDVLAGKIEAKGKLVYDVMLN